jgi:hemerythrin
METGDRTVDGQHRGLVDLFNGLLDAEQRQDERGISLVLEQLCEYVIVHFSAEEALMKRVSYPDEDVAAHLAEHQSLNNSTRDIVLEFRTGRLTSIVPVVEFLGTWLRGHIDQCDRKMVDYAKARG